MSQLRQDVVSGRWVIIASERSKRPDDFRPAPGAEKKEGAGAFCPFCEGNETKTPPEVTALREPSTSADSPGWQVRVVPNKFPALTPGPAPAEPAPGVFPAMEGVGVHEVVIENPRHELELTDLEPGHVADVLRVIQDRVRAIERDQRLQYVQVFKNKGKEAGASLSHPHSQIVATPIVAKRIKEEVFGAERVFRAGGECVFCRILREEAAARERLVHDNGEFRVIAPFASRFPFEMALFPLRHGPFFTKIEDREFAGLAEALQSALRRLKTVLSDPPYNLVLHMGPNPDLRTRAWPDLRRSYHWHFEVFPVLTRVAGFEWGTGFYINPVPPETAAGFLRDAT
jgi:UDPglucose--hexose-1-phosphate uridylyltransferase